jgi:hypothetical protein
MQDGKTVQQGFAARREFHEHFAMIQVAVLSTYGAEVHQAIDQLNRAVMAKTKQVGERSNRRTRAFRQSFHCEQKLMLLGFNALGAGRFFAEAQKLADAVPKFGKPSKSNV